MTNLTVATINLHGSQDRWRQRRHLLVAELLDTRPQLVSLPQVSYSIGQARWLRNQINARRPADTPAYALVQRRFRHWQHLGQGIAILTTLPIIYNDSLNLGYGGYMALRINVELANRQTADFIAVHLIPSRIHQQARQEQAMALAGWLRSTRPTPLQIVAGTLNEPPTGMAVTYLKQYFHSAYAHYYGREPFATFPTALAPRRNDWSGCLDYLLCTTAVRQIQHIRLFCDKPAPEDNTLYPSDHVGLLATLVV
jgi:endonuclease/exonuclease/phosphatase family metal-dependent hydrolase